MQQRRGVDELDRGGETDVILAPIAAEPRGGEREHRSQALAARLDEMGGDLGDAGRMFRDHSLADQKVDSVHLARKRGCEAFHRFDGSGVEAHYGSVCCLDKQGRLVITG